MSDIEEKQQEYIEELENDIECLEKELKKRDLVISMLHDTVDVYEALVANQKETIAALELMCTKLKEINRMR